MAKPKKARKIRKRVVARTMIRRLGPDEFLVQCYDQGGKRFAEADYITDSRYKAGLAARNMVNRCFHFNDVEQVRGLLEETRPKSVKADYSDWGFARSVKLAMKRLGVN